MVQGDHVNHPSQDFRPDEGATYKRLEDLSDSEDAAMSISGESDSDSAEPAKKRARIQEAQPASSTNAPRLSNPDPYTALPPTEDARKKKDVVQLIRKARMQPSGSNDTIPTEPAADYIAFGDSGSEDNVTGASTEALASAPPNAPTGPKLATKSARQEADQFARNAYKSSRGVSDNARIEEPARASMGTRKRTHDDYLKPAHVGTMMKGKKPAVIDPQFIDSKWQVGDGVDPCPWNKNHSTDSANVAIW